MLPTKPNVYAMSVYEGLEDNNNVSLLDDGVLVIVDYHSEAVALVVIHHVLLLDNPHIRTGFNHPALLIPKFTSILCR